VIGTGHSLLRTAAGAAQPADRGEVATDPHEQQPERYVPPEPRRPIAQPASGQDDGPSDAELLRMHVAGDPDAFGTLFRRHKDRLWAVAIRTLGDPEEAADALQDAMIAAFRRADSFRGDSAVTTWLHRIVVNAALDRMRRRAARPTASTQDELALDALATGGGQLADPSGSSDTAIDVRAALRQLVPEQQAALVLVDMLGYSVADAAQVLGVSEGTVKSRAARGRAKLLPRLAHLRSGQVPEQKRGNRRAVRRVLPAREGGDEQP
jgi:RNA polymerase sigma-70 factor (ECF subfamily)